MKRCLCGEPLEDMGYIPVEMFSKSGVFAVDSVRRYVCHTPGCETGGGMESWTCMGQLSDLAEQVLDRPLYAKLNLETRQWEIVDEPSETTG